jgi:hypothetical protein
VIPAVVASQQEVKKPMMTQPQCGLTEILSAGADNGVFLVVVRAKNGPIVGNASLYASLGVARLASDQEG